ncbi:MAG: hypothetical protein KBB83_03620 [Alphaproteobacteria bacterium]|nr:hypothetical protein [Alphaproteobacteria bacterium]
MRVFYMMFLIPVLFVSQVHGSYDLYERPARPSIPAKQDNVLERSELQRAQRQIALEKLKQEAVESANNGMLQVLIRKDEFMEKSLPYASNKDIANLVALIGRSLDERYEIFKNMHNRLTGKEKKVTAVSSQEQLRSNHKNLLTYIEKYNQLVAQEKSVKQNPTLNLKELDDETKSIMDDFVDLGAACKDLKNQGSLSGKNSWCATQ